MNHTKSDIDELEEHLNLAGQWLSPERFENYLNLVMEDFNEHQADSEKELK